MSPWTVVTSTGWPISAFSGPLVGTFEEVGLGVPAHATRTTPPTSGRTRRTARKTNTPTESARDSVMLLPPMQAESTPPNRVLARNSCPLPGNHRVGRLSQHTTTKTSTSTRLPATLADSIRTVCRPLDPHRRAKAIWRGLVVDADRLTGRAVAASSVTLATPPVKSFGAIQAIARPAKVHEALAPSRVATRVFTATVEGKRSRRLGVAVGGVGRSGRQTHDTCHLTFDRAMPVRPL